MDSSNFMDDTRWKENGTKMETQNVPFIETIWLYYAILFILQMNRIVYKMDSSNSSNFMDHTRWN